MTNGMGTEFYQVGGTTVDINNFVRGSCIYGIMPSNGLLYKPPDTCACYYQSKLEYLCALAPESPDGERLVPENNGWKKGPLTHSCSKNKMRSGLRTDADWPMYRRDATRSGSSPAAVPSQLSKSWTVQLGGKLTQPVVAGGRSSSRPSIDTRSTPWTPTPGRSPGSSRRAAESIRRPRITEARCCSAPPTVGSTA